MTRNSTDADHGDGGVLAAQIGRAPSWIAAAISCMRSVPAGSASTHWMDQMPKPMANNAASRANINE